MSKVKSALSLCGEFETVRAPSWVPSRGSLRDSYMGSFKGFFRAPLWVPLSILHCVLCRFFSVFRVF